MREKDVKQNVKQKFLNCFSPIYNRANQNFSKHSQQETIGIN